MCRREKNKEHAKLARDRKKIYIEKLQETVVFFEEVNAKMTMALRANSVVPQNDFMTQRTGATHALNNSWGGVDEHSEPLDYI